MQCVIVVLLASAAGTMGGGTRQMVVLVGMPITVWYSTSLSTSARCLCCPPQLVVFTAAVILAICCLKRLTVKFEGWPMILSIGMEEMIALMALHTLALLKDGEDMFDMGVKTGWFWWRKRQSNRSLSF